MILYIRNQFAEKRALAKVKTKGVKGSKQLVQQVTKVNGETTDSELISSKSG